MNPRTEPSPLSSCRVIGWILCLAALSVGARNFEPGLSLEGILYASMGREIARTGEWFLLDSGVPDFSPYVSHPHLGFWLLGALFYVAPPEDWAARLVGHAFYAAFLFLLFTAIRRRSGERVAIWAVLLLWAWYRFSNIFSNAHLDPGTLFFGSASVFLLEDSLSKRSPWLACLSGACLGLTALYKGLTALGFLPALALIALASLARGRPALPSSLRPAALWILGLLLVVLPYLLLLRQSRVPDFLERYWAFQMTNRFAVTWSWGGLFSYEFWRIFLRDTYYLAWLALPAAVTVWRRPELRLPVTLLATFILMFAPAGRIGGQYWLMTMPWTAWLIGQTLSDWLPFASRRLVRPSAAIAVAAVLVIQYLPFPTHKWQPGGEMEELKRLKAERGLHAIVMDLTPHARHYLNASPFFWYADLRVIYQEDEAPVPKPSSGLVFRSDHLSPRRIPELTDAGWCRHRDYGGAALWLPCEKRRLGIGE